MDATQIVGFLANRIDQIFQRPLMYGGTSEGVDIILHYYHELWAMICYREKEYQSISWDIHAAEGCDSANFTSHYRRSRPHAPDEDAVLYVVEQWARISKRLGMPIGQDA